MLLFVRQGDTPRPPRPAGASWWRPATTATTTTCGAAPSACAATWWRSCPPTRRRGIRIELFGDEVESIAAFDPLTGKTLGRLAQVAIYPTSHYVTPRPRLEDAHQDHRGRADDREAEARARGQAARGAAALPAHDVRPRDAAGGRATATASRTTRATSRAARRASRRPRCSTTCPRTCVIIVDESHQSDPPGARDVPRRPRSARRRSSSTASACPPPSTTGP